MQLDVTLSGVLVEALEKWVKSGAVESPQSPAPESAGEEPHAAVLGDDAAPLGGVPRRAGHRSGPSSPAEDSLARILASQPVTVGFKGPDPRPTRKK